MAIEIQKMIEAVKQGRFPLKCRIQTCVLLEGLGDAKIVLLENVAMGTHDFTGSVLKLTNKNNLVFRAAGHDS